MQTRDCQPDRSLAKIDMPHICAATLLSVVTLLDAIMPATSRIFFTEQKAHDNCTQ